MGERKTLILESWGTAAQYACSRIFLPNIRCGLAPAFDRVTRCGLRPAFDHEAASPRLAKKSFWPQSDQAGLKEEVSHASRACRGLGARAGVLRDRVLVESLCDPGAHAW